MSAVTEETAAQLLAALKQQQPTSAPPAALNGFAMPGAMPGVMPGMVPAAAMQPMGGFGQPQLQIQPKGISITINFPLPDGSQLPIDVHFGPEYMANLQGFAQMVFQQFGQALRTFQARNQFGGGGGWQGGNGGGGWNSGRGRRW